MADLREILTFYRDAGVDAALAEAPIDRFAEAYEQAQTSPRSDRSPQSAVRQESKRPPPARQAETLTPVTAGDVTVPDETQVALARELAGTAQNLDELKAQLAAFDGCNLKFTAKNLVFADGNPDGPLMVIGEAPGRDEDIEGLPFVGRSGQLLDRMLAAIGLNRNSVYVANVIPWRPPGNRTPTPLETEICRPFIERQIELANPDVIVTLGGPASKVLLKTTQGIMRQRGNWSRYQTLSGAQIDAMPSLHPAYLLRNPAHKRLAWRDFLEVKVKLQQAGAGS